TPIGKSPSKLAKPNQEIYKSTSPFPSSPYSKISEQYYRGYKILVLTLYPIQYVPQSGKLLYFETMTLNVHLKETSDKSPFLRNSAEDKMSIQSIVDNPQALDKYAEETPETKQLSTSSLVNASQSYQYVIITTSALNSSFQPLVAWKNSKGINATTVLKGDILTDPSYFSNGAFGDGNGTTEFNSTASRIRNFIKDAYLNWETEYVLLGGDVGVIPKRGLYAFVETDPITIDYSIPSDLYFGALDGNWNNDNDTVWGETIFDAGPENGTAGEEADFFAEVYIGRATVDTAQEATNFVDKTLWYESNSDDDYLKKALMIAEMLDTETMAGNGKDLAAEIIPQYTTTRLYSRDGTFSQSSVVDAINTGTHILNHDGHCSTTSMMELNPNEIDTLIVNDEYFFGYSLGCYAAAFDASDSVAEHFIFNAHGAFAFISNSRYGWYFSGSSMGPGEIYDRAFFQVLTSTTQNLGKALQLSKESQYSANVQRWTYFNLNLLGDPETPLVVEIKAPTAHFDTDPTPTRMAPPVFKGVFNLTGKAKKGTAAGSTFSNFTVDYGRSKNPSTWQSAGIQVSNNGQSEVVDDLLATWDTRGISPGIYTIRLSVQDSNGTTGQEWWIIEVQELPTIRILPSLIETQAGLMFTVSAKLTDPVDLFGIGFQLRWNSSLVDYVSHSIYIPKDTYLWGVLYEPIQITKDEVNQTIGQYWIEASSSSSSPFEKDGTVFNMTFQATTSGTCYLTTHFINLTNSLGEPILHRHFNGTVEINPGVHDIAVTDIMSAGSIVGQGYSTSINLTISNQGTFTEDFNCTTYANDTVISVVNITLDGLDEVTLSIPWDTTSWTLGNYTISVDVSSVEGETATLDNFMEDGIILVTTPGDVDGDFDVDIFDIVKIAGAYGSVVGDPQYNGDADVDGDGDIDIFDVVIAASNYGTSP
ncbi:MAG: C25 family cysteine peptidase, partial [Candidatus Bathyarchaeota archaeon]|nr:C25 family cysteine peptidase [Candidatus Bathyarchaeota archaeon]